MPWHTSVFAAHSASAGPGSPPHINGGAQIYRRQFFAECKKPYQVVNGTGYEVERLADPRTHPLPKNTGFDPIGLLVEQEWLLNGTPLSCLVATVRCRVCPLYVPDPCWMALHKLWLAQKPGPNPNKKPKDERQGNVLQDATRYFLADTYRWTSILFWRRRKNCATCLTTGRKAEGLIRGIFGNRGDNGIPTNQNLDRLETTVLCLRKFQNVNSG